MSDRSPVRQRLLVQALVILLLIGLYGFTRLPTLPAEERARLAARFAFTRLPLAEGAPEEPRQKIRRVHPSLEPLAGWISSVGAAVALADLDGDGLANDVCQVDPEIDRVVVAPAPGTGERFAVFTLEPDPLPYDRGTMAPMGCLPGDLNEDGLSDLVVYYWGRTPVAFVRLAPAVPLAGGAFRPLEVVPYRQRWYTNAATLADVDGDGHADLVIGNYFQDDALILDRQGGGEPRMQHSMSRAANAGRNRLLLWQRAAAGEAPEIRFREAAGALTGAAELGWTLAVGAADLDGDLLPELYFANDFGPDRLLHNRSRPGQPLLVPLLGKRSFTTPGSKVLGRDSFKGMGIDFADLDDDGWLDLYVSNIAEEYALEESHFVWVSTGRVEEMRDGVAPYVDLSESLGLSRSGWSWDSRLADFDNDGVAEAVQATGFLAGTTDRWPELHELAMGNDDLLRFPWAWPRLRSGDDLSGDLPNPFFVRGPGGRYFDLAAEVGLGQAQVSRGLATADIDGDGDLDLAVANQWQRSYLYRNDRPGGGGFLALRLLLPVTGPQGAVAVARPGALATAARGYPAIGASAAVELAGGRRLVAQVDGGSGHSGVESSDLHFGLGAVEPGETVTVALAWRDGTGAVRRTTLHLTPGWHTVLLGASGES